VASRRVAAKPLPPLDGNLHERHAIDRLRCAVLEHLELVGSKILEDPALLVGDDRIHFDERDVDVVAHRRRRWLLRTGGAGCCGCGEGGVLRRRGGDENSGGHQGDEW